MPAARFTQIRLRNFKSIGPVEQTVDLKPLTVLIGRNNSGKSTIIQGLLLLKQTLDDPRPEVQLALQGNYLRATSLREITHGWPEDMEGKGPEITLRWRVSTHEADALSASLRVAPEDAELDKRRYDESRREIELSLHFGELASHVVLRSGLLVDRRAGQIHASDLIEASVEDGSVAHFATEHSADPFLRALLRRFPLEMDHFLPEQFAGGGRFGGAQGESLATLRSLVSAISYVSSSREEAPPFYARPLGLPSKSLLPRGENAPELLYGRRSDTVHMVLPVSPGASQHWMTSTDEVTAVPLKDMVDTVLHHLGITARLSFQDARELGVFRMFLGRAPLNHVGRGIGHVLPIIVAGLLADPLFGQAAPKTAWKPDTQLKDEPANESPASPRTPVQMPLPDYLERCEISPIVAFEELEAHLHPKAESRLAEFLVALARSGRQLIVETHSDHLVRRLRRLIAQSAPGSEAEAWLLANVNIVEVEQSAEGVTTLHQAQLTREGWIEKWPADFMDEAADEERAIHFAALEKAPPEPPPADEGIFEDTAPADEKR